MLYNKVIKSLCVIILASFVLQSCAKDDVEPIVTNEVVTSQLNAGGNNNGGNNNGGNNNGDGNGKMDDDADQFDSDIIVEWTDLFLELDRYAEFRGDPRTFTSFEELAAENGYSRVPLGVHIEIDCTEGLRLGYEIADAVNQHNVKQRRN